MENLRKNIISNSREYRKKHLVPSGYTDLDLCDLANWQVVVYGNHTTSDIMDAYNDSKLQYVM